MGSDVLSDNSVTNLPLDGNSMEKSSVIIIDGFAGSCGWKY